MHFSRMRTTHFGSHVCVRGVGWWEVEYRRPQLKAILNWKVITEGHVQPEGQHRSANQKATAEVTPEDHCRRLLQKATAEGHSRRPLEKASQKCIPEGHHRRIAEGQKVIVEGHCRRPSQKCIAEGHGRRQLQKCIPEGHSRRPLQKATPEGHHRIYQKATAEGLFRRPLQKAITEVHHSTPTFTTPPTPLHHPLSHPPYPLINKILDIKSFTRWIVGHKRAQGQCFSISTTSDCKKFKQNLIIVVSFECSHHLLVSTQLV